MRICSVEGCEKKYSTKGYCRNHYNNLIFRPKNRRLLCSKVNCRRTRYEKHAFCYYHAPGVRKYQHKYQRKYAARANVEPKEFLRRTFSKMQNRVRGQVRTDVVQYYKGLPICPRQEFIKWGLENKQFLHLFEEWKKAGRQRALVPSIDRIDTDSGYLIPNMQWLTLSENSIKANEYRWGMSRRKKKVVHVR